MIQIDDKHVPVIKRVADMRLMSLDICIGRFTRKDGSPLKGWGEKVAGWIRERDEIIDLKEAVEPVGKY